MDNSTTSAFGIDLGGFFGDIGNKYAEMRGYSDIESLAVGEAAKNVARLTDKPGSDVKQTPAVIQPGQWAQEIQAALPVKLNLSNHQLALAALVAVGLLYIVIRKV